MKAKQVNYFFSKIATRYDLANRLLSFGVDAVYWRPFLVKRVKQQRPERVLDLASGSGDVALALRRKLSMDVPIVGLDFCEPMLEQARQKQKKRGLVDNLSFGFGDCMALSEGDDSADAVTIAFGVRNFGDRQQGLKEIRRVLKPGGKVYVLEFSQPFKWFSPIYYGYLKYVLPGLARLLTGEKGAYDYLGDSIEGFPSVEQLAEEMKEAGFSKVKYSRLTLGIVAVHVGS